MCRVTARQWLAPACVILKWSLLRSQLDHQMMTKGVKLPGRVVDAAGKPIPGARVSESSDGMTFLTYNRHTETDAEGRFHFHFNPNEKVTLTVQVKDYEPDTKSVVVSMELNRSSSASSLAG